MATPNIAYKKRSTANRPNDMGIERLELVLDSGSTVDLLEEIPYAEIALHQDIFGAPMICEILVTDGHDFYNKLPLKNNETLIIEFYSPGGDIVSKKLRLTDHSEIILKENRKGNVYKLKFFSIETITNRNIKVSRSYTGRLSDIVGALWSENFKTSDPIKRTVSHGEHTIVLPFDTPFSHIKKFSTKAFSDPEENLCDFLFFEDFNGYNFVSLDSLASQPSRGYFRYEDPNTDIKEGDESNTLKSTYIMKHVSIEGSRNLLDYVGRGVYNSLVTVTDIKDKTIKSESLNFHDVFNTRTSLNPEPPFTNQTVEEFTPISYYGHKFSSQYSPTSSMKRSSIMGSMFYNKVTFESGGNSSLNVGDVINLDFVPQTSDAKLQETYDLYRSGRYIVSRVSHVLNRQTGYTITVEACSDSVSKAIPTNSEIERQ